MVLFSWKNVSASNTIRGKWAPMPVIESGYIKICFITLTSTVNAQWLLVHEKNRKNGREEGGSTNSKSIPFILFNTAELHIEKMS